MNQSNSGYSGQGHTSHLTTQYSQQSSHPQHLPHTPKHPQTQPHSYGPHSTSTSSYQYPSSSRQTHPGSYRTTTPDYNMMGGQQNDMSHKRKLETISQQDQKRPRLTPSSTQQSNMVMGQGGAGSMTPMKTEGGEKKEDREGEKWDVLQVMGLPKFFSDSTSSSSSRKGNDLKNIPVAEPSPDPEAKKAFIDKTALGQKMRLITHEFKMQVDDKTLQLVHDALLFALRDILDGLVTLYPPSPRVYTVEDLLVSLERNVYIHRKARDIVMRPPPKKREEEQQPQDEKEDTDKKMEETQS